MPLVLNTPRQVNLTINAVKIVAAPSDNDLNTTTIYAYEGNYDAQSGVFTAYRSKGERILNATQFAAMMALIKAEYDANHTGDPQGIHAATKIVQYNWLAGKLGETEYTIV